MRKYFFLVVALAIAFLYLIWPAAGEIPPAKPCQSLSCRACDGSAEQVASESQDEYDECLAIRGYQRELKWFGGYHLLRGSMYENDHIHESLAVLAIGAGLLGAIYYVSESWTQSKQTKKPAKRRSSNPS